MNTTTETQLVFDFAKPIQGTFNFDNNIYFGSADGTNMMTLYQAYNIAFRNQYAEVGRLDWKDGTMKFIGNADESAQLFFDNIIKRYIQTQLPFNG